jgi:hypothetical protein
MYSHIHNPILDEYWHSRDRYQPATQDNWDWQALADAMKKITITRRHWLTKHTSGWCSVGVMAKRWKLRASGACPRCTSVETTRHVWRCQHQGALEVWDKSMERLQFCLKRFAYCWLVHGFTFKETGVSSFDSGEPRSACRGCFLHAIVMIAFTVVLVTRREKIRTSMIVVNFGVLE